MAVDKFPIEASHIMMFARSIGDGNKIYYDEDYAYLEEEDKKNWSRFTYINTAGQWNDWYSLASEYENKEKEENKKKYIKPKKVIRKRKN